MEQTLAEPLGQTPRKRTNNKAPSEASPDKKKKTESQHIKKTSEVTDALLLELKIKDDFMLSMRAGHKTYILNKGTEPAMLDISDQICGYGKDNFKMIKDKPSEGQVPYLLKSMDDG